MFSRRGMCNDYISICQSFGEEESNKENSDDLIYQTRTVINDDDESSHSECMIIESDDFLNKQVPIDNNPSVDSMSMEILPEHLWKSTELILAYENRMMDVRLAEPVVHLRAEQRLTVSHLNCLYSIPKRHLYLSSSCNYRHYSISHQTRVLSRSPSRQSFALGFIREIPSTHNHFRHLVLFDDGTAAYTTDEDKLNLCLSEDFQQNVRSIELNSVRDDIQANFCQKLVETNSYRIHQYVRVKKFGEMYHNAQIIEIDCSLLKLKFYQRQAQTEIWIYYRSALIDANSCTDIQPGSNRFDDALQTYITPNLPSLSAVSFKIHQCSSQCVSAKEKSFDPNCVTQNPYTLPLTYGWTYFYIDRHAQGPFVKKPSTHKAHKTRLIYLYRSPCGRSFLTLNEIEVYLSLTNSKLSIKFFIDDRATSLYSSFQYDPKYIIEKDIAHGKENVPIPVFNETHRELPEPFDYGTEIRSQLSLIAETSTLSCCSCTDDCRDRTKCSCWLKTFEQAKLNNNEQIAIWKRQNLSNEQMLTRFSYLHQRLKTPVWSGIYECNSKCSCHRQRCTNRVVQNGLYQQLQLFHTKNKGWGLRVLHDIPHGSFINAYIGELVTEDIAAQRDYKYLAILDHKSYLLTTNAKKTTQSMINQENQKSQIPMKNSLNLSANDENEDNSDSCFILDAKNYGSISRFYNHSCKPNVNVQNVFIETHDPRFPILSLFASRSIRAGEEICWDYNYTVGCMPGISIYCQCQASNCRGRLL